MVSLTDCEKAPALDGYKDGDWLPLWGTWATLMPLYKWVCENHCISCTGALPRQLKTLRPFSWIVFAHSSPNDSADFENFTPGGSFYFLSSHSLLRFVQYHPFVALSAGKSGTVITALHLFFCLPKILNSKERKKKTVHDKSSQIIRTLYNCVEVTNLWYDQSKYGRTRP